MMKRSYNLPDDEPEEVEDMTEAITVFLFWFVEDEGR
jgi:hypothetical protein